MKDETATNQDAAIVRHFARASRGEAGLDIEAYFVLIEDLNMSEADKRALLETLAMVVTGFVDLAHGVHPVQEACGKRNVDVDCTAKTDSNETSPKEEQTCPRGLLPSPRRGLEAK